jgi:hypothetical protein
MTKEQTADLIIQIHHRAKALRASEEQFIADLGLVLEKLTNRAFEAYMADELHEIRRMIALADCATAM